VYQHAIPLSITELKFEGLSMLDTSLDLALDFLRAHPNWYIFPITRLEKFPPLLKDNLDSNASNDPKQIKEWHTRWRGCNWGIALRKSNVIVVDVDRKAGKVGQETLDNLELEFGPLPATLTVMSPSGGLHYYFNGEHRFGLGKHGFGQDIDSPNYVLIPGCWLCTNAERGYEIITDAPVVDAPEWFGEFLKEKAEKAQAADEPAVDLDRDPNIVRMIRYLQEGAPKCIQGQNGDKTLYDVACVLKDNGVSESRAIELLATYYNTPEHCDPVWQVGVGPEADRLDVKVANAYRYSKENQAGSATAEYAFGAAEEKIDYETEIAPFVKAWERLSAKQTKDKDKKRAEKQKTKLTDEALGIDPLTGEEVEQNVIDPLTGEPFAGLDGDGGDDEPPKPGKGAPTPQGVTETDAPAGDAPEGEAGEGEAKAEAPKEEMPKGDGGAGTPKKQQTLKWVQANWIWVVNVERFVRVTDGAQWSCKQFDSYYNNLCDRSSISNVLFASDGIRKVERIVYRPGQGVLLDSGRCVNIWRPSAIKPKAGDAMLKDKDGKSYSALDTWDTHLNYLFQNPEERDLVLNWMAWVYQFPKRKPNHGLLIVGAKTGTGKSWVARVMEQLIGPENTQRPKNTSLKGDFNAWAEKCKLCIIEELMQIGRREVANELRDTITESTIEVNIKNVNAHKIENYMAMMAITNHRDAMPMEESERRWLVVETFADTADAAYYNRLWPILESPDALAAIAYQLQNRNLGDYNASLPPVRTDARAQMIELSRSDLEHWLYDMQKNPPLSYQITTLTDIIEAMPQSLQKSSRLRTVLQTFVREKVNGEMLRQVRIGNGNRVRLWALNGKYPLLSQMTDSQLVDKYEAERKQGGSLRTPEEQAAVDFGD
jgi:hypothetical protein